MVRITQRRLRVAAIAAGAVFVLVLLATSLVMAGILRFGSHPTAGPVGPASTPASSPTPVPTPAGTSTPTPFALPAGPNLVVTRGLWLVGTPAEPQGTIEVLSTDGRVIASTNVAPMPVPLIGNAATIMPRQVVVAAGAVYYADRSGRIHRFERTGADTVVATFPFTGTQQELSFAVSPDGTKVMATVMSTPPLHDPPPRSLEDPLYAGGGHWTVETFLAPAGGPATSIARRQSAGLQPISVTRLVGWDAGGPLAVLDAVVGAQNPPPSLVYAGSALVHLALDGTHLGRVGGASCVPLGLTPAGVLCYPGKYPITYEVRDVAGSLKWSAAAPAQFFWDPALSPDAQSIAASDRVLRHGQSPLVLPPALGIQPEGWLTNDLLVFHEERGLFLFKLSDPGRTIPTGVDAHFAGAL